MFSVPSPGTYNASPSRQKPKAFRSVEGLVAGQAQSAVLPCDAFLGRPAIGSPGVRFGGAASQIASAAKNAKPGFFPRLWKEYIEWYPKQKYAIAEALEAFRNKISRIFAGVMMALSAFVPLPKWLYAKISRDYFFSPRKVMSLTFKEHPELNKEILSHSFQLSPKSSNLDTLHSIYLPAKNGNPTIVFSHGRDTNVGHLGDWFKAAQDKGYGFFAYDYPGFGKSDGSPSEAGLKEAGAAACRYLASDGYGESNGIRVGYGVPYKDQILMGYSLGGGVASDVAKQFAENARITKLEERIFNTEGRPELEGTPRGLILANTFTSLEESFTTQLEEKGPTFLAKMFRPERMEIKFESENAIKQIGDMSVQVFHCKKDPVIPYKLGEKLAKAAKKGKFQEITKGRGHGIKGNPNNELDAMGELFGYIEKSSLLQSQAKSGSIVWPRRFSFSSQ